jgi:hypothetical protein
MEALQMVVAGVTATLFMDLWQRLLHAVAGIPPSNWALVGRWFVQASRGTFFHDAIAKKPEAKHELAIGWAGHYATGIVYGVVYVLMIVEFLGLLPSIRNGLVFGVVSVVVPWFFFMPAMGVGVLAKNAPNRPLACGLALAGHTVFGVGLAVGAMLV